MITIVPGHLILIVLICAGKGVRVTCKYVCNGFGMRIFRKNQLSLKRRLIIMPYFNNI